MNNLLLAMLLLTGATTPTTPVETPTSSEIVEEVPSTPSNVPTTTVIEYTKDSVIDNVVTLVPRINEDQTIDLLLEIDLPFGYVIYDDKDTNYIEGILVNETYLTDYVIVNYDSTQNYTIIVKTAYAPDITGELAKLQDGDWSLVFQNPLTTIQIIYYVLATIILIITFVITKKDSKKKLKNAEDVASASEKITEENTQKMMTASLEILSKTIAPVLSKLETANSTIIKALALLASNSKEAPLQILNLLESFVQGSDMTSLVEEIKANILTKLEADKEAKQKVLKALETITDSQEVTTHDETTKKETKSVF